MGKFFVFCRIKLKFCFWLCKKRWHTSWKFQLEITSNKKVIAKKPLTNLYEMNSNNKFSWYNLPEETTAKKERKQQIDSLFSDSYEICNTVNAP